MARNTTKVNGVTVVLPKRKKKLSEKQREAARKEINRRRVKNRGSRCRVIFFPVKKKGEKKRTQTPVMRCEGSSLKPKAKRRWKKLKGRKVCRNKRTGTFRKCR